jgi:Domain of unknown function (DUF5666)
MRNLFTTAVIFSVIATAAAAQGAGPANPPVSGVVQSFDGKILTVAASGGIAVSAQVTSTTRITQSVPKTLADIKPGDFVASGGTRGPDGKLHANEIRIFSAPGGEGQFPMAQPGQTMTNATVKEVMTDATVAKVSGGSGAPMIKLTFHGAGAPGAANCTGRSSDAPGGAGTGCVGETEFDVPANTPVVAQIPGDPSMLKPGTKVSMNVAKAPDGSSSAARIAISR